MIVLIFSSCTRYSQTKPQSKEYLNIKQDIDINSKGVYGGFNYDNSTDLDSIITQEYSLKELENYFELSFSDEKDFFDKTIDRMNEKYLMNGVTKTFKIQCLRKSTDLYYTVYKVKEGGRYFVFWSNASTENEVIDTLYMKSIKSSDDFKNVKRNKSTLKDVREIEPSTELIRYLSNGIYSYTLLDDGDILQIKYDSNKYLTRKKEGRKITENDLIVQEIKLSDRKDNEFYSLKRILNKDIPQ